MSISTIIKGMTTCFFFVHFLFLIIFVCLYIYIKWYWSFRLIYLNKDQSSSSDLFIFNCGSEEEVNFSTPFHAAFGFLITLLLALVGVHFQGLGVSPLKTHFATILLFLMAVVIYSIAFVGIKVGAHNTSYRYLPLFNFICLISGTLACELLVSILITPLWLLIINLCAILVEVLRRCYQPIFDRFCHPAN